MMEDGSKEVKLYDLSEGVSDDKIIEFLKQYGEIISIREQMWNDQAHFKVSTGIRIVRMMVQKNIDSFVIIDGELTAVSYYGQRQTCKHCLDTVHNGITCVQNKQLQVQKSYADAAKQSGPPKSTSRPAKTSKTKAKSSGSSPVLIKPIGSSKQNSANTNTKGQAGGSGMPPPPPPPNDHKKQSGIGGKLPEKRTDGNETDDSTTSNSSRRSQRNINKKPKYNDSDQPDEVLMED